MLHHPKVLVGLAAVMWSPNRKTRLLSLRDGNMNVVVILSLNGAVLPGVTGSQGRVRAVDIEVGVGWVGV